MSNKKRKAKKLFRKKLFGIGIIIIFAFAIFKATVNYGMGIASYILFPIQSKIYEVGNYIKDTSDTLTKYKEILKENNKLKEKFIKYERILDLNSELIEENSRYRKLLHMKEKGNLDLKIAKVNFKKHSNLYEKFYIDLGKDDGIKKDMIVLTASNILIGRVSRVYSNYSIVQMITAENSSVSGLSKDANMLGMVKGSNEDDGTIYFEPNTFKNTLKLGEKIYTSGISDIYPKNLYIGYVSQIEDTQGDVFRSIKLKNDVDILNFGIRTITSFKFRENKK